MRPHCDFKGESGHSVSERRTTICDWPETLWPCGPSQPTSRTFHSSAKHEQPAWPGSSVRLRLLLCLQSCRKCEQKTSWMSDTLVWDLKHQKDTGFAFTASYNWTGPKVPSGADGAHLLSEEHHWGENFRHVRVSGFRNKDSWSPLYLPWECSGLHVWDKLVLSQATHEAWGVSACWIIHLLTSSTRFQTAGDPLDQDQGAFTNVLLTDEHHSLRGCGGEFRAETC